MTPEAERIASIKAAPYPLSDGGRGIYLDVPAGTLTFTVPEAQALLSVLESAIRTALDPTPLRLELPPTRRATPAPSIVRKPATPVTLDDLA